MGKVEGTQNIPIKEAFSKGFIRDLGQNNMNSSFSPDSLNIRIKNGSTVVRGGTLSKVESAIGTYIRGLVANNSTLYAAVDSKFQSIDLDAGDFVSTGIDLTFDADFVVGNNIDLDVNAVAMTTVPFNGDNDTTLADIATQLVANFPLIIASATTVDSGSNDRTMLLVPVAGQTISITDIAVTGGASQANGTFTTLTIGDANMEFVTFGIYTIILTGTGLPYVYDGITLSQLTTSEIEDGANIKHGAKFTNFTFVSGNGTDKTNVLYISVGITAVAQTNSYDWVSAGSEQITMKGNILGLEATLNRLYVFTDKNIEFLDKSSLSTVGGEVSFYTSPIGTGEELANSRTIVSAGESVFYITKDKKIKTINYLEGSVELSIGDLSDRKDQSIQGYLDTLSDDLSDAWGFYDRKDNVVKWGLKSKGSLINDIVLIYDITNDTFLIDGGYFYSTMAELSGKNYGGGFLNSNILLDNDGKDDDGFGIEWHRKTAKLFLGTQSHRKAYRGLRLAGQYNALTQIDIAINVNGKSVYSGSILGALAIDGIGNYSIGDIAIGDTVPIGQLIDFAKIVGRGNLNDRGYYIQATFSGNKAGQELSLDSLEVTAKGIGTDELEDK